jgi:hypothetical protein
MGEIRVAAFEIKAIQAAVLREVMELKPPSKPQHFRIEPQIKPPGALIASANPNTV